MASLTGQLVAETYKALLKTIDNDILTASEKQITDGLGGGSNVFIDSQGFLRANKYKVTNGLATQFLKADGSLDANTYLTGITSSQIITALGYTPVTNARTLTINGTTYDLSANRSWTVAGTAAIWGNITGTLSNQTDLQNALNAKYNNPTGTISQYIRGDGTLATFPTLPGGLPTGGTAGQILAKIDATDYNTHWIDNFATQTKNEVKLGQTLAKGAAVYVSSANGTNMIVSAASNASEATSSKTLGLLETGGVTNDLVKCVTFGLLAGLDTSTATAGDPVWLGVNGALIFGLANKPYAPAHLVYIGVVTRVQSNNGEIFVNVQNGFELKEIHDVYIADPANNNGLFYDSADGLWKNKSIASALGYTPQAQLNGTGFVKASGTTISYDNSTYLTTANAASTYLALTGGTLTGSITATSFVKTGGTSNEYLRADGSVNVITGDIISGSGTAGYIAKFGSSAVIASSNLFESGANIGFGTITLNYGSYGRAFTGAGFGSTSFGFEAVTGSTTNGGLIGGLSLVIAGNDSTRRIGSAIQSYISGATSTHQGADLRFFVKPDNGVLLEVVRMTSAGITFNKDLTAENITATTFVKSGGLSTQFLMADGSVSTYTNPVTGTGSAGYIPKWTSASNLGSSIIYEDTSIGIAYTTPNRGGYGRTLSGASFGSASFGFEAVSNTTTNGGLIGGLSFIVNQNDSSRIVGSAIQSNLVGTTATNYGADLRFYAKADGVFTIAEVARMTSAGLRVYGTLITDGNATLNGDVTIGTDKNLFINGDLRFTGADSYIWSGNSASGVVGFYDPLNSKFIIKYENGGNLQLMPTSGGVTVGNSITAGSFVKSGGTSSQYLMANGSVSTLTNPVTGTGTTNYVASWTISGSLGNSTIYDNGTNIGIGTNTPFNGINNRGLNIQRGGHSTLLLGDGFNYGGVVQSSDDIKRVFVGANIFDDPSNAWSQFIDGSGYAAVDVIGQGDGSSLVRLLNGSGNDSGYGGGNIFFESYKSNSNSYIKLRTNTDNAFYIFNSGNIGVNTTTDAGFKLDVNGTGRFSGTINCTNERGFRSSDAVNGGSSWLFGANSGSYFISVNGGVNALIIANTGAATFSSSVTAAGLISTSSISASTTITATAQMSASYYRVTNSNGVSGYLIPQATWFGAGVATNLLIAAEGGNSIGFMTNGTTDFRMFINTSGNVGIGTTTDSGYKLDINGTARIQSRTTISASLGSSSDWALGVTNSNSTSFYAVNGAGFGMYLDAGSIASSSTYVASFVSNGVSRLFLRGDGYIGINTGSPSAFLHINESSYGTGLLITTSSISGADITLTNTGSGGKRWDITSGGSNNAIGAGGLQFYNNTDGSMRMGISSAGNVLIGTATDGGFPLLVGKGRDGWQTAFVNNSSYGTTQVFFGHGEGYGAYIDSGTHGNSTARYIFKLVSGGTERVVVRGDGLATFSSSITATSFFESSDFRLKTLIESNPIVDGIEKLEAKLYEKNGKIELGYFAQDAEKLMPYAVTKNPDGFLNLSYREVHTAKIARLEKEVAQLKAQLNLN